MTELELREHEAPGQELAPYKPQGPISLFGEVTPDEVVARASSAATSLARVIEDKKLYNKIGPRRHVNVEGWTLLGSMLGIFPVVEWSRPTEDGQGWEARVSVRNMAGQEVGSAEAMCTREEKTWKNREDYAIRSMAQTRAVSKAMRHPLGFVMTLAGYDPTPEAEMPAEPAPKPQGEPLSDATRDALLQALPRAEFFDPTRWNLTSVLVTASRTFGHEVNAIADLYENEAQRILEGATKLIAEREAEYAAATDVEEAQFEIPDSVKEEA